VLARSEEPTDIERCVAAALAAVQPRGPKAVGKPHTTFMLTGDSQVFSQRFEDHGCLGFLAAGARNVQSLELALRSETGRELARSGRPSALAYALHCAAKGEVVFATVRVIDGQGEAVFAVLDSDEPRPLPVRTLETCAALGTPRPAPLDMGPEPLGLTIEQQLETTHGELAALGYGAASLLAYGTLHAGEHTANGALLSQDHCYALVAVGGDQILDLDLRVFGPTLPLTAAGADTSRGRAARVKLCSEPPGRYVLDISSFAGEGAYAVAAFELAEPATTPGITGPARIDYAELLTRMSARGFRGEVLTAGIVGRDEQLTIPLTLREGACFALGALDTSEHMNASLQLGLKAADGSLVALDATTGDAPLLFHCATTHEQLQAVVSAGAGRGQTRFSVLLGREAEAGKR
jgi:hypothetical protein